MHEILGVNERFYPAEYNTTSPIKVVLVGGAIGDYAAYAGAGTNQWVADHGDKVSFAEACIHFPGQLKRELYRD